jgi:diaminopimelate epimerase
MNIIYYLYFCLSKTKCGCIVLIEFFKYQGTGNDFIMLNNFSGAYDHLSVNQIVQLCNRKFGIGADGLIKINKSDKADFEVEYFNADASKSFCGNGARCSVAFAAEQKIISTSGAQFDAIDGLHTAKILGDQIHLQMLDVDSVFQTEDCSILDTGSPHYVWFEKDLDHVDMFKVGQMIRYSDAFQENGINVNGVEVLGKNHIKIRTYERGVEAETLSCGTGATAAAIVFACNSGLVSNQTIAVDVEGGKLQVAFKRVDNEHFEDIFLIGPAEMVFNGSIQILD